MSPARHRDYYRPPSEEELERAYPGRPFTLAELAARREATRLEDRSRRRWFGFWLAVAVAVWAGVIYLGFGGPAWP